MNLASFVAIVRAFAQARAHDSMTFSTCVGFWRMENRTCSKAEQDSVPPDGRAQLLLAHDVYRVIGGMRLPAQAWYSSHSREYKYSELDLFWNIRPSQTV